MSFFFLFKPQAPSTGAPAVTLTENPLLVFVAPAANMIALLPEAAMTAAADAGNWTVKAQ